MKIKLGELIQAENSINKLYQEVDSSTEVDFTVKLKLGRFIKIITPEIKEYYEIYRSLLEKYGEPVLDENGQVTSQYSIKPEHTEKFGKNLEKLLNYEIEIQFDKFTIKDFENIKTLTTMDAALLSPFIEGDAVINERKNINIKFDEQEDESTQ